MKLITIILLLAAFCFTMPGASAKSLAKDDVDEKHSWWGRFITATQFEKHSFYCCDEKLGDHTVKILGYDQLQSDISLIKTSSNGTFYFILVINNENKKSRRVFSPYFTEEWFGEKQAYVFTKENIENGPILLEYKGLFLPIWIY